MTKWRGKGGKWRERRDVMLGRRETLQERNERKKVGFSCICDENSNPPPFSRTTNNSVKQFPTTVE